MRADILIVGQGLAGTWLAWELERAGVAFALADPGHENAATMAAAGIINPITGRRLVKSWRTDPWLPRARSAYRDLEQALGVSVWRDMRVRRLFADEHEREVLRQKLPRGDFAPFVEEADEAGFWIEGAARVDLAPLLASTRARWAAQGRLRVEAVEMSAGLLRHDLVIDCRGRAGAIGGEFSFVPWEYSKGEVLEIAVAGLDPGVVLNRRHWIAPVAPGLAWVGATHEPGQRDAVPTAAARTQLETSAREILGPERTFAVLGHRAGVRVTLPDKRPVAGRHPEQPRLGLINGLGAKGALWAPLLARQWVNHLTEGVAFEPEVDVRRFMS